MHPSILAERIAQRITFMYPDLARKIAQVEKTLVWAEQQRQAQLLAKHRERQQRITFLEGHLP